MARSSPTLARSLLVAFVLSGCCFDGLVPSPIATPVAPPPPSVTGGPHMPGGPGTATFGTLTIRPGFAPDPMIAAGRTASGAPLASFLDGCVGYGSRTPTYHLTVEGDVPMYLRVMAYPPGGEDLTIALRGESGVVVCNDDFDGLMPLVETTVMPGEYDVWVGTYSVSGGSVPFDLGVSTNASVIPTNLHAPPPPAVLLPPSVLPPPTPVPVPVTPYGKP